ncbi:excitatory amino acid transporter 1-like [Liolophura sinensis]|uniref:excitatory amino acid transporter 1-like n=1 Tax=Liolophura sinensis TaxID=3198878 RepID=UPI0031591627
MEPLNPKDDLVRNAEERDRKWLPKSVTRKCFVGFLKSNLLVLLMLVGVLVGVAIGLGLNSKDPKLSQPEIVYLRFPGELFLQSMKMLLIPIVVSSLLCATAEIDIRSSGKIGLRASAYYISTLVLASVLGVILVVTVRPGDRTSGRPSLVPDIPSSSSNPGLAFMDLFRNMVPDNLVEVCFKSKKTREVTGDGTTTMGNSSSFSSVLNAVKNISDEDAKNEGQIKLIVEKVDGINMMGLVVASILFGCVTSASGNEAKPFLDFFKALRVVSFKLVAIFIWYSPVGIAFLIASKLAEMDDPTKTFKDLAIFTVTVLVGLFIHGFIVLSLLYLVFLRKNPLKFLVGMVPAMLFAFGSESSSATLPVTIKCLEEKNGVDPRVTKLIASIGATVNMDGTCLYFTMMAIFIAQFNGIPLSAGQLVTISILSLSIAMGAAGVPGTGVIYMIMILTSMGLPTDDISTLLAVDWFLARCRTSINILGDGIGAAVIEHFSRHDLKKMAEREIILTANSEQDLYEGEAEQGTARV